MGGRSITNLIDGFHRGVDCGIETDGVLGQAISRSMVPGTPMVLTPRAASF